MMTPMVVPAETVESTLRALQEAGRERKEKVVVWLARRSPAVTTVSEAFVPIQYAEEDYFRIPPEGMQEILDHLRTTRMFVAAQVHSHPCGAFHSFADDTWAIVRHEGALSLVVPHFAQHTTVESFEQHAALFVLLSDNTWRERRNSAIEQYYLIQP